MRRALLIQWDEPSPTKRDETLERRLVAAFGLLVEAHQLLQKLTLATSADNLEQARDWIERYESEFPDFSYGTGGSPLEN
jgi:hypothetical protein